MNDTHHLPLYNKTILFADDTTIFNSHKSKQYLKYTVEHYLCFMIDWFKANKLSLNLNKTIAMKFWKTDNNTGFKIEVEGISIPFLGVYIDSNLSWNIHLNHLIDKLCTNK